MIKFGKKEDNKKDPRQICVKDQRKSRGFTLIEMLVAIAIFILVIGSAVGLFVSAIRSQAQALATQKLLDETSYVMEYMSRALRMAKKDDIDGVNCLSGTTTNYEIISGFSGLKFRNYQDICQGFFLQGGQLKEYQQGRAPDEVLPLTSGDLEITPLQFNLSGEAQTDNLQPRVTISMTIQKAGGGPKIKIQTSISQRNLDVWR